MLRKCISFSLILAILGPAISFAQDVVTEREVEELDDGAFESPFRFSLRFGALNFDDTVNEDTTRFYTGLTFDWLWTGSNQAQFGVESGVLFSHLGPPDSGFFGDEEGTFSGSNLFNVPLNLVAGYAFAGNFLITVHGGGNLVYRSISESLNLGRGDSGGDSAEIFPSVGASVGYGLSDGFALTVRGESIITPADDLFSGTLGMTFPIA